MLPLADVVLVVPVHDEVAVLRALVLGDDAVVLGDQWIEVMQRLKARDAGPGLGRRSADGADDEADRNVRLLLDAAGEVECDGGDAAGGVGGNDVPGAADSVGRVIGRALADREETNMGKVRSFSILSARLCLAQAKLHVGLAPA